MRSIAAAVILLNLACLSAGSRPDLGPADLPGDPADAAVAEVTADGAETPADPGPTLPDCHPEQALPDGNCCIPGCGSRQCGNDPCGAPCGDCQGGKVCGTDGTCACADPTRACGDGCCGAGQVCTGTACCTPDCAGKTFGDDGCGGCCDGCCPDGTCRVDKGENCTTCPQDCKDCCVCGDDQCLGKCGETLATCATDCHVCGDGLCTAGEDFQTCQPDCCGVCNDGRCNHYVVGNDTFCNEDEVTCAQDCHPAACGNGTCDAGESIWQCPVDCQEGACGNHRCDKGEDPVSCPEDCAATCGNCACEGTESAVTCPADCGVCGDGVCSNCPGLGEKGGGCPKDCG